MKRDEIIEAIEKMRSHGVNEAQFAEFTKLMQRNATRRSALADDFHRALAYSFIIFMGTKYIPKQQRIFLRPTLRAVLFSVGLLIAAILQIGVLGVVLNWIGLEDYAIVIIIFAMLFELGYIASKGNALIRGHTGGALGLSEKCVQCKYDLTGHDSLLGEKLWVGPEICPECGGRYPAVV
jgi:hypothetical protein